MIRYSAAAAEHLAANLRTEGEAGYRDDVWAARIRAQDARNAERAALWAGDVLPRMLAGHARAVAPPVPAIAVAALPSVLIARRRP